RLWPKWSIWPKLDRCRSELRERLKRRHGQNAVRTRTGMAETRAPGCRGSSDHVRRSFVRVLTMPSVWRFAQLRGRVLEFWPYWPFCPRLERVDHDRGPGFMKPFRLARLVGVPHRRDAHRCPGLDVGYRVADEARPFGFDSRGV